MTDGGRMSDPVDEPVDLGFSAIDGRAGSTWMSFTGMAVGLIPLVVLGAFILFALAGPVAGALVLGVGAAVVALVLSRRRRPARE
jgi:hypothetical protein